MPGEEQFTLTVPNTGQFVILARSIKSRSGARARSRGRTSISGSRRSCIRLSLNASTEKNTTGGLILRKFPGTSKAVRRFMVMTPSGIGYRSGIGLSDVPVIDSDGERFERLERLEQVWFKTVQNVQIVQDVIGENP